MADDNEDKLEVISDPSPTSLSNGYGQGSTYGIPAPKKRSKKPLYLMLAGVVVVLVIGAVIAYFLVHKTSTTPTEDSNVISTATVADLPKVCQGKVLTNAQEVKKPYKFAAYMKQNGKDFVAYPYFGKGGENLSYLLSEVNTIACLIPDESTTTGDLKCTPKNVAGDKTYNITQKGVTYDVTFYAAQTGAKITEGKVTSVAGTDCIDFAEADGTYYTMPINKDVEAVFEKFFAV